MSGTAAVCNRGALFGYRVCIPTDKEYKRTYAEKPGVRHL